MNLITDPLWKRMKCFPSILRRRNLFSNRLSLWKPIKCFPSTLRLMNLKTEFSLWKRIRCFREKYKKTQQSPAILNLCLRKTRAEKSRDYRDVIVFKNFFFNVLCAQENEKHNFHSIRFEKRFRKAPLWRRRISVDGRANRRKKASTWVLLFKFENK